MDKRAGVLATDGFVRLTLDGLLSLRIVHLVSGIDGDDASMARRCGTPTFITGYTEWGVDVPQRPVSLGWDWCLEKLDGEVTCVRVGLPRSNVMLVGPSRRDYGWERNLEALASVVDALPWADCTRRAVQIF